MQVQNLGTKPLNLGLKIGSVILKPTQACEMTEAEYKTLVRIFPCLHIVEEEPTIIVGESQPINTKVQKNGNKKTNRKNKK